MQSSLQPLQVPAQKPSGKIEATKKRKQSPERVERHVQSRPAEVTAADRSVHSRQAEVDLRLLAISQNVKKRPAETTAADLSVKRRAAEAAAVEGHKVQRKAAEAADGGDKASYEVGEEVEYFSSTINDYMKTTVLACRLHETKGFEYDLVCKKAVVQDKLRACQKKNKRRKKEKGDTS